MNSRFTSFCLALTSVLSLSACSDDGASAPHPEVIYAEIIANGALSYRDQFTPSEVLRVGGRATHTFDPSVPNGPRCIGSGTVETETFAVTTRSRESDDLVIFLQGGGLCAESTSGACMRDGIDFIPVGVLSPGVDQPLREASLGYVPYCDGSLFLGDTVQNLGGEDYVQRGRQNITAALDVFHREFPNPRRIMLTGISAGGFSTLFAAPMVRVYWPDAEVMIINDSGAGITRGDREPEFVDELLEALNADHLLPESCTECFTDGHAIRFMDWVLDRDPTIRSALISHTRDDVISGTFLDVPQDWFETELERETSELSERYGDRYGRYIIDGDGHTAILAGQVTSNGDLQAIYDWLGLFIDRDPSWGDVFDPGT